MDKVYIIIASFCCGVFLFAVFLLIDALHPGRNLLNITGKEDKPGILSQIPAIVGVAIGCIIITIHWLLNQVYKLFK